MTLSGTKKQGKSSLSLPSFCLRENNMCHWRRRWQVAAGGGGGGVLLLLVVYFLCCKKRGKTGTGPDCWLPLLLRGGRGGVGGSPRAEYIHVG